MNLDDIDITTIIDLVRDELQNSYQIGKMIVMLHGLDRS